MIAFFYIICGPNDFSFSYFIHVGVEVQSYEPPYYEYTVDEIEDVVVNQQQRPQIIIENDINEVYVLFCQTML